MNKFENGQHAVDAATESLTVDVRSVRKIRTGLKAGGITTGKCTYVSILAQDCTLSAPPVYIPG